mmetsp:Transcript_17785/g.41855  ORF Transcript_17785/g.41855 Transcript_17785/m.41855 type:complete len:269 (+) Transcript_17785:893-1699(+)
MRASSSAMRRRSSAACSSRLLGGASAGRPRPFDTRKARDMASLSRTAEGEGRFENPRRRATAALSPKAPAACTSHACHLVGSASCGYTREKLPQCRSCQRVFLMKDIATRREASSSRPLPSRLSPRTPENSLASASCRSLALWRRLLEAVMFKDRITSVSSGSLTRVSSGESQLKLGEWFTSSSTGLRFSSRRMSKPRTSKHEKPSLSCDTQDRYTRDSGTCPTNNVLTTTPVMSFHTLSVSTPSSRMRCKMAARLCLCTRDEEVPSH